MLKEKDALALLRGSVRLRPSVRHQQIVHPLSLPALYGPMSRLLVELSRHPDLSPRLISLRWRPLDLPLPAAHSSTPPPLRRRSWAPPPSSVLPPNPAREPRPGKELQRRYPEALRRPPSRLQALPYIPESPFPFAGAPGEAGGPKGALLSTRR